MKEVVLFFPDTRKLAEYSACLNHAPVEINSSHLTLKAMLGQAQIAEALSGYEAVHCSTDAWAKLEQWFENCRKRPCQKIHWHLRNAKPGIRYLTPNTNNWMMSYTAAAPATNLSMETDLSGLATVLLD